MKITGNGFSSSSDNLVLVDGVSCNVIEHSETEITCETGSHSSVSTVGTEREGNTGASVHHCPGTTSIGAINLDTCEKSAAAGLKAGSNKDDSYAKFFTGYFKVPKSGQYRFLAWADD